MASQPTIDTVTKHCKAALLQVCRRRRNGGASATDKDSSLQGCLVCTCITSMATLHHCKAVHNRARTCCSGVAGYGTLLSAGIARQCCHAPSPGGASAPCSGAAPPPHGCAADSPASSPLASATAACADLHDDAEQSVCVEDTRRPAVQWVYAVKSVRPGQASRCTKA